VFSLLINHKRNTMKIILSLLLLLFTVVLYGQEKQILETTFTVQGNCNICKDRIEKAAYIKGVKRVSWDVDSKSFQLIYRADKTTPRKVMESIAAIGHDTQEVEASEKAYNNLHHCCKYRTIKSCE